MKGEWVSDLLIRDLLQENLCVREDHLWSFEVFSSLAGSF